MVVTTFFIKLFYTLFSAIYDCQNVAQNYILQQAGQQACPHRFCIKHLKAALETLELTNIACPICEFDHFCLNFDDNLLTRAIQKMARGITVDELRQQNQSLEEDNKRIMESCLHSFFAFSLSRYLFVFLSVKDVGLEKEKLHQLLKECDKKEESYTQRIDSNNFRMQCFDSVFHVQNELQSNHHLQIISSPGRPFSD